MSRRTLMIASLSAAFAFAGGYALLDTMRPATTRIQASSRPADPSKVVAIPGSALVPMNDGTTDWMLVGPDGTVLAGPDGRPPAGSGAAVTSDPGGPVGIYLEDFEAAYPEAQPASQDETQKRGKDERRDHEDHDDDHDDKDRKEEKHQGDDDHDDHGGYALSAALAKPTKASARSKK